MASRKRRDESDLQIDPLFGAHPEVFELEASPPGAIVDSVLEFDPDDDVWGLLEDEITTSAGDERSDWGLDPKTEARPSTPFTPADQVLVFPSTTWPPPTTVERKEPPPPLPPPDQTPPLHPHNGARRGCRGAARGAPRSSRCPQRRASTECRPTSRRQRPRRARQHRDRQARSTPRTIARPLEQDYAGAKPDALGTQGSQ